MAKRKRTRTQKTYEKWIKEGRGQGEGLHYKPWLTIQDVPSEGIASRGKGWKTGRVHHTLSKLELWYFYLLEWSPNVLDIREQYPLLPIERTIEIASELGVKHPTIPNTDEPVVMTTDFLINVRNGDDTERWARQIKPESRLTAAQIDKFRIEQRYYAESGVTNWGIVTDREISAAFAQNVEDLHGYFYIDQFWDPDESNVYRIADQLLKNYQSSSLSLSNVAIQLDQELGFENGTCLRIAKHMIARKLWITDMTNRISYARRIEFEANCAAQDGYKGEMA